MNHAYAILRTFKGTPSSVFNKRLSFRLQMQSLDQACTLPDQERCIRSDGQGWRCSRPRHPGLQKCDRHGGASQLRSVPGSCTLLGALRFLQWVGVGGFLGLNTRACRNATAVRPVGRLSFHSFP